MFRLIFYLRYFIYFRNNILFIARSYQFTAWTNKETKRGMDRDEIPKTDHVEDTY